MFTGLLNKFYLLLVALRVQEVLMDFPQLTMTMPDGREESIMKRTTLVLYPHHTSENCAGLTIRSYTLGAIWSTDVMTVSKPCHSIVTPSIHMMIRLNLLPRQMGKYELTTIH